MDNTLCCNILIAISIAIILCVLYMIMAPVKSHMGDAEDYERSAIAQQAYANQANHNESAPNFSILSGAGDPVMDNFRKEKNATDAYNRGIMNLPGLTFHPGNGIEQQDQPPPLNEENGAPPPNVFRPTTHSYIPPPPPPPVISPPRLHITPHKHRKFDKHRY